MGKFCFTLLLCTFAFSSAAMWHSHDASNLWLRTMFATPRSSQTPRTPPRSRCRGRGRSSCKRSLEMIARRQVGPIDMCELGCCGTGMHTPAPDGTYTGSDNHLYTIYDPRGDSEETWDQWNLECKTSVEGGKRGKLVVLESRTELDCRIEYMNDEFDDPPALHKYSIGLKGKTTQNVGIFKWEGVDVSPQNFDAATPSWTNWKGGSTPATANAPCVYMEIGQTSAVNGLWSLSDCNKVTMLGICEFE